MLDSNLKNTAEGHNKNTKQDPNYMLYTHTYKLLECTSEFQNSFKAQEQSTRNESKWKKWKTPFTIASKR